MKKFLVILFFISLFSGIAFNVAADTINDTEAPVADADGPYTVVYGDDWTLDGTGSYDSLSAIVGHFWDVDYDGTFAIEFSGPQPMVAWSWMVANNIDVIGTSYNIVLEVVDAFGNTDTDGTTLEVVASPVPEPATMLLFGLGLLGLAGVSRKKK